MQRWKVIFISAFFGALVGVAKTKVSLAGVPFLAPDKALLEHRAILLAAVALWALFGVYWEWAAKNSAAAKRSESQASRGLHVFLVNVALLLEIAPIHGWGRYLPASALVMAPALAVEAAGLALAIWARRHLGRYWSGEITIKVEHQLIRSGPYRLLRHPIYTGLLTMYVGVALLTGEWLAIGGLALAVVSYWRKIRLEEDNLRVAFGADYEAYRGATWALLPGLY